MKILGIISICFGVIVGAIVAAKGRIPDAMAGATIFIGLGVCILAKKRKQ